MKFLFSSEINSDLVSVDKLFKQSLFNWWDDICVYHNRIKDEFTWKVLPAVVLQVYRYFGLNHRTAIALANIFRTIYFSNCIHELIRDDDDGQQYNNDMQFTILIGDYIFGRVLKLLVESDVSCLLSTFSSMMCELDEGMILQYKLKADRNQVIKKSKAPLYAAVFDTAAQLSGLGEDSRRAYRKLGYNLGMSLELSNHACSRQEARDYIHKTELILEMVKDSHNTPDSILHKVTRNLHANICGLENVAVVV
ncbi:MAG: hypothetical protein ACOX6I_03735 [Syntrophomonadaceae bacterium]|jgi:geranylgeranyl pyrophosphate synthase